MDLTGKVYKKPAHNILNTLCSLKNFFEHIEKIGALDYNF